MTGDRVGHPLPQHHVGLPGAIEAETAVVTCKGSEDCLCQMTSSASIGVERGRIGDQIGAVAKRLVEIDKSRLTGLRHPWDQSLQDPVPVVRGGDVS